MMIKLHANAALTPAKRAYVRASHLSAAQLAAELSVSEDTIRRWKGRTDTADRSSRPDNLQTRFTLEEETIVAALRTELSLSPAELPTKPETRPFGPEPFGYVHIDLKYLTRLEGRPSYVFVAIERVTRFVHAEIITDRSGQTVAACLERFLIAFGHPVHTILTDNGAEFTDRFGAARWHKRTTGTGHHPFDQVCAAHGIKHRLTQPFRPQTNGMVERFNRRIRDAIGDQPAAANQGKNRFASHHQRNAFVNAFVDDYNRTRLRCLNHKAPAEVLANLTGHNTFAGMSGV